MPSQVKDSPSSYLPIKNTHIPSNTILVTIDVSSLNIPRDKGMNACLDAIEAAEASHIPRNCQIYQQIQGMAIGTKMAPSYAKLQAFLAQEPILPLV